MGRGAALLLAARTAANPSVVWCDKKISGTDTNSYSFASTNIGTAATGRRIVVAVNLTYTTASTTATCTIGGNSATSVVTMEGPSGGGGYVRSYLFILQVDSGTTATIAVATSNNCVCCGIGTWALYDLNSSTATDTGSDNSSVYNDTIDVSAGGILIGTSATYAQNNSAWTNIATEDYDETVETSFGAHSGASEVFASAQTARSITWTPSGGTLYSGVFTMASFR